MITTEQSKKLTEIILNAYELSSVLCILSKAKYKNVDVENIENIFSMLYKSAIQIYEEADEILDDFEKIY